MINIRKLGSHPTIKLVARLLIFLLNRFILIISIPFVILNACFALIVIIKNWSLKHTKELNV
jgi:hypothetical protein